MTLRIGRGQASNITSENETFGIQRKNTPTRGDKPLRIAMLPRHRLSPCVTLCVPILDADQRPQSAARRPWVHTK